MGIVEHASHGEDLWYSNDNDFKKLIPGFNKNNKYQMRFRGYFVAPKAGTYRFKTRSDDGSMLYLRQTDGKNIHKTTWKPAGKNPIVKHWSHSKSLWYSNGNDFKNEIPKFKKNDKYIMRFRGQYEAKTTGNYRFRTRSDDGSRLWIDRKLKVNNDGNHGMRTKDSGNVRLTKGWHEITVVFYENGGGSGLEVSVLQPTGGNGGKFEPLTSTMTRAAPKKP